MNDQNNGSVNYVSIYDGIISNVTILEARILRYNTYRFFY